MPVEVMARRGADALRFGPMRPIGLTDPRTGRRPYAVVQLRQDNLAGSLWNIVGFQTNLRWREQRRVLRMIPGLQSAEFLRYGMMHRNTYINAPQLLHPTLQWRLRADLFFAGQIVGVEGGTPAMPVREWSPGSTRRNAARQAARHIPDQDHARCPVALRHPRRRQTFPADEVEFWPV